MRSGRRDLSMLVLVLLACAVAALGALPGALSAQTASGAPPATDEAAPRELVPVTLDGEVLFHVRGMTAYPAQKRAREVGARIRAFAADRSAAIDSIRIVDSGDRTVISAAGHHLMNLFDEDGAAEGVTRRLLADVVAQRIAHAAKSYREDRTLRTLLRSTLYALGATLIAAALLLTAIVLFRRLRTRIEKRLAGRIEGLAVKSGQAVRSEAVWMAIRGVLTAARALAIIAIAYFYLNFTLVLYPWTRSLSRQVFSLVLNPLRVMGAAFIDALPGLVFIIILWIVTRYVIRIIRYFFAAIAEGRITLPSFDSEWAWPTYRLVLVLVLAFAVVVSYPHIPGSSSGAFKGVSLFLGLVFSLGSSATIGNMIAGYSLTYRRAFKIGDRIRVEDAEGIVSETGLLVTHVRTIKNEDVIIPNSVILGGAVVNFSKYARTEGLILHTTVRIGYETPWRQVEAMLTEAAGRTPGLLKDPPPFVLQRELGEFAVTYELNAHTDDPARMVLRYADLHRNILDVFNEYGVQIMTPAYEGDPEKPKTVSRDRWYAPPAGRGGSAGGGVDRPVKG